MSPITVLICTILLSNKVISNQSLADEESEEYPNLSCHKGFYTPDEFGLVLGPFTKKLAVTTCKGIDALVSLPKTHECYRRCLLEQLFILGTEEYSKNGLDWNYEKTGLNCEEDMIGAMSQRLFNVNVTGTDAVSRLAREIHLKCADKGIHIRKISQRI
ncbi:hypothetical protein Ocin01_14803 [Orchesella cincta]|uniref:Uncharacterized protein n=1 Tax=Orchesella cincta TaxID=48709 RepID=A0A1D2MFW5_ORCCI|nr:hypothetical protein Ocin01_14803 [Orchesella cincta]